MNRHDEHNRAQIEYFSDRELPRMAPDEAIDSPYVRRHVSEVRDVVGLTTDDAVLDVGCGPGKFTIAMQREGYSVRGLDLTPLLVETLQATEPLIEVDVGDVMDPPVHLHDSADVVTGYFMLHHVPDVARTMAGVAKLLRPGGRAAFCEPNPYFFGYYAQITFTPGMTWKGDGGIVRMRRGVVRDAAVHSGLEFVGHHRYGLLPPALANRDRGRTLERAAERVPGWSWGRAFQIFHLRLP